MSLSIHKLARPNLFWKIFLWFWLATLITLSSVVFLYSLTGTDSKLVPITPSEIKSLRKVAITIQLRRVINDYRNAPTIQPKKIRKLLDNAYIINRYGVEITGKDVPETIYQLRSYYNRTNKQATVISNNIAYIGPEIVFNRGSHYQLYITQKSKQHFMTVVSYLYHSASVWNLLATFGISALVCFGLAWYLTRPIHQLQKATQAFASGDLNTRASHFMSRRHDEFTDLAEDFDQMADKISIMIHSHKRLLSDVSHELRSPLTRMQIASSLALKKANDDNKEHLERIELEIYRLDQMIGELLQVAALERGHFYEEKSNFILNDLIAVLVNDACFEAEANKKSVIFDYEEDLPFNGYYGLMARSIENILRNAIRHTPINSEVSVLIKKNNNKINIIISDQGSGVFEQHLVKIFDPFYRPTEARERTSGGAGLGLAIAKRGVEANHGTIEAKNKKNGGLKVIISLPLLSA